MGLKEFFGLPPNEKAEEIDELLVELDQLAEKDEQLRRAIQGRLAALKLDLEVMSRNTGEKST